MDECTRTYCPPIPQTCPHTYGVRVGMCAAVATKPCRPTACISVAPFRHTPCRFRARQKATVWRNLQQHPRTHWTYTFSAKEKDSETGLSYFGARYYSSDLSIWLSVDPQAAKYPSLSQYVYCANNPVKLVDPNGESVWIIGDDGQYYQYKNDGLVYRKDGSLYQGDDSFVRSAQTSLKDLQDNSPSANKIIGNFVENLCNDIEIRKKEEVVGYKYNGSATIRYENEKKEIVTTTTTTGLIFWNPQGESIPTVDGMKQNGTLDLIHEFVHALDKIKNSFFNEKKYKGITYQEWTATYYENIVREEMNLPLREYYYKHLIGPNIYEGKGETIIKDGKPWLPRSASKIF